MKYLQGSTQLHEIKYFNINRMTKTLGTLSPTSLSKAFRKAISSCAKPSQLGTIYVNLNSKSSTIKHFEYDKVFSHENMLLCHLEQIPGYMPY